jgi:hypothetical protein
MEIKVVFAAPGTDATPEQAQKVKQWPDVWKLLPPIDLSDNAEFSEDCHELAQKIINK